MPRKTLRQQLEQTHAALKASQDNLSEAYRWRDNATHHIKQLEEEKRFLRELLMRLTNEDLRLYHPKG